MAKILLYQPYYHFPGHFKSQFLAFRKELTTLGFSCLGVVGLQHKDEIEKFDDIRSFHYQTQNRTLRIFVNFRGFANVRYLLKREPVSVIHFLDVELFQLYLFARLNRNLLRNVRVIITQHSINRLQNNSKSLSTRIYRRLVQKSYSYLEKHFDLKVITNGEKITHWLVQEKFLSGHTIETAWWGSSYIHDDWDFSSKKPDSFLFYGILRKDKNIEFLLETFSKITHPFHLHIAGYPRDYSTSQLQELLDKYGFSGKKVTLETGYLSKERIRELLQLSSFIVLPYSSKNLSNSGPLIDAIQFGCIPIASGYGERRELISQFDLGYLFYFDKKPALEDILADCLSDNENNNHFREVLKSVKNQFTWEWIIRDLATGKKIYSEDLITSEKDQYFLRK